MQPFFVVAPPKTGSTLLTRMLCQHPQVTSMRESYAPEPRRTDSVFHPDGEKRNWHGFSESQCRAWQKRLGSVAEHSRDVQGFREGAGCDPVAFPEEAVGAFREVMTSAFEWMSVQTGATVAGDSWPFYGGYLDLVLRAFPDAKLVHAIRDPRAVAHSRDAVGRDVDPAIRLHNLTTVERQVWPLVKQGRCFVVQYERLVRDPDCIKMAWQFLGVDPEAGWLEYDADRDPLPGRWGWIDNAKSPMDASRCKRWLTEMRDSEIAAVHERPGVDEYCRRWGYPYGELLSSAGRLWRFLRGAPLANLDMDDAEDNLRGELQRLSDTVEDLSQGYRHIWERSTEPYAQRFHDPMATDAEIAEAEGKLHDAALLQQFDNWIRWRASV